MRAAVYMRVSLDDGRQTNENQRQELAGLCARMGWDLVAEFSDSKSGKNLNRSGFQKMMVAASKHEFDILVFWDLSRLTRSGVRDVLFTLEQLKSWGVAYRSMQEPYIDALGPFSDVVVAMLASIAKLEREKIRERTLAGLSRARKEGRIGGRPRADADNKLVTHIHRLKAAGKSIREIAEEAGTSRSTVQRLLAAA